MPVSLISKQTHGRNVAVMAGNWLAESGIQAQGRQAFHRGGVYAWWDLITEQHSFIYSEITGYAINAYLFLFKTFNDSHYLDCAELAAEWVLRTETHPAGLLATRYSSLDEFESYFNSAIFTFDQWMVIDGLCNASRILNEKKFLTKAIHMAQFLIKHTQKRDGSFYPIYDLEKKEACEMNDRWSRESGSFLSKAILGLDALYRMTDDLRYKQVASDLVKSSLKHQDSTGRFITQSNEKSTHLHPCLYTLEGLLAFAIKNQDHALLNNVKKSFDWILNSQLEHGGVSAYFKDGEFLPFERTDILAQTLRLGVILWQHDGASTERTHQLERLLGRLQSYQIQSGPQRGGFLYGQEDKWKINYHVNAWVTMFALQAIALFEDASLKASNYDFEFFI